jgi:hypothetical protein
MGPDSSHIHTQRESQHMNRKQQLATAILGLVIVGSVAFMPVSAERKAPRQQTTTTTTTTTTTFHSGLIAAAPVSSPELAQDQVRDLTYN